MKPSRFMGEGGRPRITGEVASKSLICVLGEGNQCLVRIGHATGGIMKALVEWSDELSVGIEEIDEQHKVLVNLVNNMHAAIVEHKGSDATKVILRQLIQYTIIIRFAWIFLFFFIATTSSG